MQHLLYNCRLVAGLPSCWSQYWSPGFEEDLAIIISMPHPILFCMYSVWRNRSLLDDRLLWEQACSSKLHKFRISLAIVFFVLFLFTDFISHSFSLVELKFLFQKMLPDLSGKTLVDVGSRLGAVLYAVKQSCIYFFKHDIVSSSTKAKESLRSLTLYMRKLPIEKHPQMWNCCSKQPDWVTSFLCVYRVAILGGLGAQPFWCSVFICTIDWLSKKISSLWSPQLQNPGCFTCREMCT